MKEFKVPTLEYPDLYANCEDIFDIWNSGLSDQSMQIAQVFTLYALQFGYSFIAITRYIGRYAHEEQSDIKFAELLSAMRNVIISSTELHDKIVNNNVCPTIDTLNLLASYSRRKIPASFLEGAITRGLNVSELAVYVLDYFEDNTAKSYHTECSDN